MTGVQTCALPISAGHVLLASPHALRAAIILAEDNPEPILLKDDGSSKAKPNPMMEPNGPLGDTSYRLDFVGVVPLERRSDNWRRVVPAAFYKTGSRRLDDGRYASHADRSPDKSQVASELRHPFPQKNLAHRLTRALVPPAHQRY